MKRPLKKKQTTDFFLTTRITASNDWPKHLAEWIEIPGLEEKIPRIKEFGGSTRWTARIVNDLNAASDLTPPHSRNYGLDSDVMDAWRKYNLKGFKTSNIDGWHLRYPLIRSQQNWMEVVRRWSCNKVFLCKHLYSPRLLSFLIQLLFHHAVLTSLLSTFVSSEDTLLDWVIFSIINYRSWNRPFWESHFLSQQNCFIHISRWHGFVEIFQGWSGDTCPLVGCAMRRLERRHCFRNTRQMEADGSHPLCSAEFLWNFW